MKIKEIINEVRAGNVPDNFKQSSAGLHIFSDAERANTDYTHYRLKQSYKIAGANYKDLNKGNLNSMEVSDTNKVSPTAKPKKNKYGV